MHNYAVLSSFQDTILDGALKVLSIIKKSEYFTKGLAYLSDVAADFVIIKTVIYPF